MWDEVIGHKETKQFLQNMLAEGHRTPSLLFYGPAGIGKGKMALEFAKSFMCLKNPLIKCHCKSCTAFENNAHPDLIHVWPQGSSHTIQIEQVKQLVKDAAFSPIISHYKVCIIHEAERFRIEAANAILKLLEEPPEYWLFILVSDQPELLLPTILSRVIKIKFEPLNFNEVKRVLASIKPEGEQIPIRLKETYRENVINEWNRNQNVLASLAGGSAGKALDMFRLDALTLREQLVSLLEKTDSDQLMVYMANLAWLDKKDTQESSLLIELLTLLVRDGLLLMQNIPAPLYNEDMTQRLLRCFRDWSPARLRRSLDLLEEARRGIQSFVGRRLVMECLFLQLRRLRKEN